MSEMNDIVIEFVEEGNEKVSQLEHNLIDLEKNPTSGALLTEVFRALHTIKGATSFLGFTKLCTLAHTAENLLARLRNGTLVMNQEITSALLSLVDAIREILSQIAATGKEGNTDYTSLLDTLNRLQKAK